MLTELINCKQCSFHCEHYPPITPSLHTNKARLVFVGENPSWEFGQRIPFDSLTKSGQSLFQNYILPLKKDFPLFEADYWITDLFKCRYPKEIIHNNEKHSKQSFENIRICVQTWLTNELEISKPEIIVTLGDKEVFQRLNMIFNLGITGNFEKDISYKKHRIAINQTKYYLLPACHPDISSENRLKMKASTKWAAIHKEKYLKILNEMLNAA